MAGQDLGPYTGGEPYVFVSYSTKDRGRVLNYARALRQAGWRVWWDEAIHDGDRITETIVERIGRCAVFLLFLSPSSDGSEWCQNEFLKAKRDGKTIRAARLVPEKCPFFDFRLGDIHVDRLYLDDAPDTLEQILADAALCREKTPADLPRSSDQLYVDLFTSPLFLHKHAERRVSLYELFIPQRFDMDAKLADFIRDEWGPKFLIIEGDAGCGKTSLTAYLCYHFHQQDEISRKIFGDRRMTAIRLRDLDIPREGRPDQRLLMGILRQLWPDAETDRERMKRFQDEDTGPQVLFLDGYDELCTNEGIESPGPALRGLRSLGCKIIVTIRPKYLRFRDLRVQYDHIALEHLDKDQRVKWIDRYIASGQTLDDERKNYLENIEDGGICDTPLGLYMVAAGRFPPEALKNEWALYHQIFFQELSDTDYSQISGDLSTGHPVREYREALYQVGEEIAWHLYQNGNEDLLVSMETVREIVKGLPLLRDDRTRAIVERCFALCGYWKTDTQRGCVEFYHNNIRDFFLCEKIMRELDRVYQEHEALLRDPNGNLLPIMECLCKLFRYGDLERRVLEFLRLRATWAGEERPLCVQLEEELRCTDRIFEGLLLRGEPWSALGTLERHPVRIVSSVFYDTIRVYRSLYAAFLKNGERIRWWTDVDSVKNDRTLRRFADRIIRYAGPSDLRDADLRGADLRGADLSGANLSDANLRRADLIEADLHRAYLGGADLSDADLRDADLRDADLRDADLRDADLSGADLREADLYGAYLREADLYGADLDGADLGGADLYGADLYGADLRGARIERCALSAAFGTPIL